ncbi:MAG TPA: hypothetical protein DCO86_00975 [Spirochaetaceae bacterium]|nr:hypothetical protein [Spirochaetaceae bacterium]
MASAGSRRYVDVAGLIDSINQGIDEGKSPIDFPGNIKQSVIALSYLDERTDYDCNNRLYDDGSDYERDIQINDSMNIATTFILKQPSKWPGHRFIGWSIDFGALGVNVKDILIDHIRKFMSDYEADESEVKEYLKTSGIEFDFEWSDLGMMLLQPGEDFMKCYRDIICALTAYDCNAKFINILDNNFSFPGNIELKSVWEYSGKKVKIEYYDGIQGAGQGLWSVDGELGGNMPDRWMYYGTGSFGKISTIIPSRAGFLFKGWEDRRNESSIRFFGIEDFSAAENAGYFNANYGDGDTCKLFAKWMPMTSYVPYDVSFGSGIAMQFSFLPQDKKYFVKDADSLKMKPIQIEMSYSIALQDISGSQLVSLIGLSKSKGWGFESIGLKTGKVSVGLTDAYFFDRGAVKDAKTDILVNGVKLGLDGKSLANIVENANGSDYPAVYLTLPQAMVICNMFTAAYNSGKTEESEKLTFAYATYLTTDVGSGVVESSSGIVKTVEEAVAYIKACKNSHLSLSGSNGFRLPRDYEYEIASTIIPSGDSAFLNAYGSKVIHDPSQDFPCFVSDYFELGDIFTNDNYVNSYSASTIEVKKDKYRNPLGMYHATGNVRKWLDTRMNSSADMIVVDGAEPSHVAIVAYGLPKDFNSSLYNDKQGGGTTRAGWRESAYNPANWFTYMKLDGDRETAALLKEKGIDISLASVSQDGKQLTFSLSYYTGTNETCEIISDLNIPLPLFKNSGNLLFSKTLEMAFNNGKMNGKSFDHGVWSDDKRTLKVALSEDDSKRFNYRLFNTIKSQYSPQAWKASDYNPANWFNENGNNSKKLKDLGAKIDLVWAGDISGFVDLSIDFSNVNDPSATYKAFDLVIPAELILQKMEPLNVRFVSDCLYYSVRSGSFMLKNTECDAHKTVDQVLDPRKSAAPFNSAYYDLGMRLARSVI